jgi:hypothetical protein
VHVGEQVSLVSQGFVGFRQFGRPLLHAQFQLITRPAQVPGDCAQLFQAAGDYLYGLCHHCLRFRRSAGALQQRAQRVLHGLNLPGKDLLLLRHSCTSA